MKKPAGVVAGGLFLRILRSGT